MVCLPILLVRNSTILKFSTFRRFKKAMILNLIKKRKKHKNPKTKSPNKPKSQSLLKKNKKSSSGKAIHKSAFRHSWPLNGQRTSMSKLINSKKTTLTSSLSATLMPVNPLLLETSWKSWERLMNSSGPGPSNKPKTTTWNLGSWLVLQMLIQWKERKEKLLSMPNWTFHFKTEDLLSLMRQAIKITFLTWSWVHARLILQSWSFRPKKVNSKLDLKKKAKQKSMPCWQKLWVSLDLWSLLPRWVLRTGRSKDSKQLRTKWFLSCKTHAVLERLFSFRWIQLIMWMFTSVSKEAGTMVLPCLSFWTLFNFQKESPWVL